MIIIFRSFYTLYLLLYGLYVKFIGYDLNQLIHRNNNILVGYLSYFLYDS